MPNYATGITQKLAPVGKEPIPTAVRVQVPASPAPHGAPSGEQEAMHVLFVMFPASTSSHTQICPEVQPAVTHWDGKAKQ